MKKMAGSLFLAFSLFSFFSCMRTDKSKRSKATDNASTKIAYKDYCKVLNGNIFRFKEAEDLSDLPEGSKIPDSVHFTIVFNCEKDSLRALMFGPDPEGEHGMFYFKEDLDSLNIKDDTISFSLVQRNLYWKPYTLNNYNKGIRYEAQGGSNERYYLKGKMAGDSIVFSCTAEYGTLYDDTMTFIKYSKIAR